MSSYPEVNAGALGYVGDNTPGEVRAAGVATVAWCLNNQVPHDDMVELLQMVGLVPTESAGRPGRNGRNISPELHEKRTEANRVRNAARRARQRKAAS